MDGKNDAGSGQVAMRKSNGLLLVIGWIAAILALVFYPFIFGVLGVIMGILSIKGGSKVGLPLIVVSIIFMGIGLIFSEVILTQIRLALGI